MRTTVTLDPDGWTLLKAEAHRPGKPFRATLNDATAAGLRPPRGNQGAVPGAGPRTAGKRCAACS